MTKNSKTYEVSLILLTPVVINTGEVYDFLELFPFNDDTAYILNLPYVMQRLSPTRVNDLYEYSCQGISQKDEKLLIKARNILEECRKGVFPTEAVRRPVKLLEGASERLRDYPSTPVQRISTNPLNEKPYIPGSSVKGALRTAILEKLRSTVYSPASILDGSGYRYKKSSDYETEIYTGGREVRHNIKEDIFKYLKVSDFHFPSRTAKTYIGFVPVQGKIPVYTAMTDAGCLQDFKEEIVASGQISISSSKECPEYFQPEKICDALDYFIDSYNARPLEGEQHVALVKKFQDYLEKGYSFLRLGHYSGIENMTFKVLQDRRVNRKIFNDNINLEGGKNSTFIENKYPSGFCMLRWEKEL